MMKKFINSQETITEEELAGFGLAYGDILTVDDHTVVSRALADADRVTIVTSASTSSAMESTDSLPALQEAQIEALPVTAR